LTSELEQENITVRQFATEKMQIAEQKDELTSFANPKSASFTDPFA
jgi:hypothetical protein